MIYRIVYSLFKRRQNAVDLVAQTNLNMISKSNLSNQARDQRKRLVILRLWKRIQKARGALKKIMCMIKHVKSFNSAQSLARSRVETKNVARSSITSSTALKTKEAAHPSTSVVCQEQAKLQQP